MLTLPLLPAEIIANTLQLGQLQEEDKTAPSQSRRPAEDHLPFPSSTSQLGPAKEEEFADALQDSNPAHDLLPVPPSILQLSEANDEGGTIPSQDLNSAPELATASLNPKMPSKGRRHQHTFTRIHASAEACASSFI